MQIGIVSSSLLVSPTFGSTPVIGEIRNYTYLTAGTYLGHITRLEAQVILAERQLQQAQTKLSNLLLCLQNERARSNELIQAGKIQVVNQRADSLSRFS